MIKAYKGYVPEIWYEAGDGAFHGCAQGIGDVIHCEAAHMEQVQREFEASVDDYLEACKTFGKEPQKPKSGKLALRITPEVHEKIAVAASADAKSLNQWIADTLSKAADKRLAQDMVPVKVK